MGTRVAVVGGGIAGVSAAYHLRDQADVTLYEAADRLGGHANTIEVEDAGRTLGLDTAFIVYNEPHYPRITQFFAELGVATQAHPGKFCFYELDGDSPTYVSDDFERSEQEIVARYPASFASLWREAKRFLDEAPRHFIRKQADLSLGDYLDRHGYSDDFRYGFIVLIATAAWSVPADRIWDMPASTVIAFFWAHGAEGLGGRTAPWRTVTGGSISYLRAVQQRFDASGVTVRTNAPVTGVRQDEDSVAVATKDGVERYDQVVLATHADDSMAVLENPTDAQRRLEVVRYNHTRATLHTDPAVMPADRDVWRSWNYGRRGHREAQTSWATYYLNDLQCFASEKDWFLTLDSGVDIRDDAVVREIAYRHPVFTMDVKNLQKDIHAINAPDSRIAFAGSYFHSRKLGPDVIGLHESGYDSGSAAAEVVLARRATAAAL